LKHLLREAFLYCLASGVALVADFSLLWILVEIFEIYYLAAATIAFLVGTAIVYAASVSVIFQHRRVQDRRMEFGAFAAIGVLGLTVNLLVLKVAVDGFGAHYLVGKLASVFFTFSLNFGLRRTFLFSATKKAPESALT
jgi:putative flippase GtrA